MQATINIIRGVKEGDTISVGSHTLTFKKNHWRWTARHKITKWINGLEGYSITKWLFGFAVIISHDSGPVEVQEDLTDTLNFITN